MTPLFACLGLWSASGLVLLALLRRDYVAGEVTAATAALIWIWHVLNYALVLLFALEAVWMIGLPEAVRVSGWVLIGLGLAVIAAGFYEFRSLQRLTGARQDAVVDSGVYRFSRHPQYLGIILTLIGGAIAGDSGAAVLFALVLSTVFVVYLPMEERFVTRAFGDEYERYRKRVPMLLGPPR